MKFWLSVIPLSEFCFYLQQEQWYYMVDGTNIEAGVSYEQSENKIIINKKSTRVKILEHLNQTNLIFAL